MSFDRMPNVEIQKTSQPPPEKEIFDKSQSIKNYSSLKEALNDKQKEKKDFHKIDYSMGDDENLELSINENLEPTIPESQKPEKIQLNRLPNMTLQQKELLSENKKRGRKKGTISQEQLDRLAQARLKSIETRKANAEARKQKKELVKKQKEALYYGLPVPEAQEVPANKINKQISQTPTNLTNNLQNNQQISLDYEKLSELVAQKLKPQQQPVKQPPPQKVLPQQDNQQVNYQQLKLLEQKIREDERKKIQAENEAKNQSQKKKQLENHAYFQRLPGLDITDNKYWDNLFNIGKG